MTRKYKYKYLTLKYKYKYLTFKYKYKYKYFKSVLEYRSSTSTSTKYYKSGFKATLMGGLDPKLFRIVFSAL